MKRFIIMTAILLWSGLVQAQEPPPPEVRVEEIQETPPLQSKYNHDYAELVVTWDGREWRSSEHKNLPIRNLHVVSDGETDYDGDEVPDVVWWGWLDQPWRDGQVGMPWCKTVCVFYSPGTGKAFWIAEQTGYHRRRGDWVPWGRCVRSGKMPKVVWDVLRRAWRYTPGGVETFKPTILRGRAANAECSKYQI